MIAYIEGRLLARTETSCVVQTEGGVGYEISLTGPMLSSLPNKGDQVSFYINTIVREDALQLYGFSSWDDRETFNVLISISKLGPKTALAILSTFSPDDLRTLLMNEDANALTRVPGIGKKTAQHVFIELTYKLKVKAEHKSSTTLDQGASNVFRDTLAGLVNLGYAEEEARPVVEKVFHEEPDLDVSQGLRQALKTMARDKQ